MADEDALVANSEGANDDSGQLRRRFPPASQFTPVQVDLSKLLEMAARHGGDRGALQKEIRAKYFARHAAERETHAERLRQQLVLAGNAVNGMANYGLLDLGKQTYALTELGEEIRALPDQAKRLDRFAQHILTDLPGIVLISAARRICNRNESVTKESLHDELANDGFDLPRATTHHTVMGQWLREAGVLKGGSRGWAVDETKFEALTGQRISTLEEWGNLTPAQQAVLRTLRRIAEDVGPMPIPTKVVVDRSETEHGRIFNPAQLRRTISTPLEDAGWLTMSKTTKGRGGKSGTMTPTQKLLDTDFELMTGQPASAIPSDIRAQLGTPLDEIYDNLESADTYTKGLALELLAMRLAVDLDLTPVRFRKRGIATGGGELDLIAEASHRQFSRWLFQCKNIGNQKVRLEDLAREVGMATLLRAHVIVIATTSSFTQSVEQLSIELEKVTPLQVILLDGELLRGYRSGGPSVLNAHFHNCARAAMQIKRIQVDGQLDQISGEA